VLELPKIARGLQVTAEADHVLLGLEVSKEQLVAGMKGSAEPAPAPAPAVAAVAAAVAAPAPPAMPKIDPLPPSPSGPQVIRILGLDEGTREIVLKPEKQ